MEKEYLYGLTEINMMENGKMIRNMEKEYLNLMMAEFMKVNIKMTKEMEKEYINGLTEINMMENGKMIREMEKEYLNFLMEVIMKVNIKMAKEMDLENNLTQKDLQFMKVNGLMDINQNI